MKKSFAILSVIIGLLIISTKGFATLTLKINNKVQADLTLEVGCTGTDMFFIGSVVNNPPPLPYSYPTPRWTGSGAAYLSDVNADFVTFNCSIPGDYEITYSAIKSGITYSITQTIRVLAKDILTLDFPTVSPYNICEGSSVSLQASGTTNYYWEREKDGNTDAIGSTATLEETPPTYGNWTYRVYGWNDGCATDPDHIEFEIDVDEAPTANANGPYSTCSGTGVALSGSIGGSATSAQWIGGAGTFTPDRNTLNATYLPDASEASTDVTLTLRTDDPPGVCSYAESNATVTVYSLPTVTLAPFADVCVDAAPFALSGGSPAGGTYSGPGVSGGNFDPSTAGVGTHTITYTYTDGNGCTNNATNTITVNALPIVTLGAFADVCVDAAPFALSGGSPAGGTYSGPGVSGGNFDPSAAGTGTHTITYVYTDANGCSNSATNTITVNALPVVTLGPFADVCVDAAPFALSGGNPAGGTYSGPGVSGGNFNPATAGVGTHTITYTYTDGNGCSNNATNTITVNALPNVTLDPFADVCIDAAPFALSGGNPTGGTYSGPGVSGGNFDPSVASVGTHTITYVYTDGSGCTNSATNTITVNALPVVTLDPFADVCLNAPAFALSGGSPNGGTYSGPGVSGNNFDPSVAGTGTHTITYIYTDANGCSNSATNTITVNALPVVTLNPFADVCVDAPAFALSGGNPAGGTYSGPGVSGGNFDPSAAGVGTHTITYIYTDANGCSNSATNTITVNALPNVTLDPFADVCIDAAPFALSGGNPAGGTYSGTGVSGGNFDPSVAGIGTFTITYIYTDGAGCTNSANNTITVNPLPAKYNVTGGGSYCYGGVGTNVGLDGSDNGITYTLYLDGAPTTTTASGNGSTMDFGPQTEGTYTVYAQNDLTGCEIQMDGSAVIAEIPEITGNTIAANQTICYNSIPAQLTGPIPGGGTGSYSYRWQKSTTGATGPFSNITGATAQNYTPGPLTQNTWYRRLVTSGSCINYSNVIAITVLPAVDNNTITADQDICYNTIPAQLDGSTPTGGDGTYTYQWQSSTTNETGPFSDLAGATSQNYTPTSPLTQSTWYRRIVNSGPCTDYYSNVIKVTVDPQITLAFSSTNTLCYGSASGTATVTPTGGVSPYSYSWDTTPVQTTQTATGLSAGTYNVTVTDNNLCSETGNVSITDADEIIFNPAIVTDVTGCYGNTNGAISISVTGGTSPYTYSLYNDGVFVATQTQPLGTSANFTSLTGSDLYEVEVTDANSCGPISSGTIVVNQPPLLDFTYTTVDLTCYGDNSGEIHFSATGGTPPYLYSINNGISWSASPDFTGLSAATYSLKTKDANGCITTRKTVKINQPNQLYSDGGTWEDVTTCAGDNTGSITVVPGGGIPPYQFSIDGGTNWQTSGTFPNLYAGTYSIIVEDASGCSLNVGPIIINEPDAINITSIDITDVTTCWYNTNGEIFIWATGGSGSLEFSIDGGVNYQSDPTFDNIGVGTYSLYIRDNNGCTLYAGDYAVSGPPEIVIDALTVTDATCFGAVDGNISSSASGGTGSLEYSIDGVTYQASGDFSGLSANNYTLYIRDANGCILTQDFTVGQPPALYFSTLDKTDITCNGLVDGTITLVAAGGSSPYNYSITGGAPFPNATGNFTSLSAGTYIPTVQDANGCITVGSNITIVEPDAITINSQSSTDITCFGANDGTITVEGIGGTAPLSYTLLDASSSVIATNGTGLFENIIPGTYTVEINDLNSCGPVVAGPFTINEPAELTFTYTTVDLVCNGDGNGEITVTASGGTLPYEYSFDGGATFGLSNTINTLSGGTYTVIVRDANGCTSSQDVIIIEPDAIALTVTATDITCNGDTNGQIDASATGGVDPMQFRLDGGTWQSSGTFAGLTANTYLVEAMDSKGCMVGDNATIVEPTAISIDNVTTVDPTCSTLGSIKVEASGGTGTLTYTLNPSAVSNTTGEFTGVGAGTYTVDVTDENGCGPISTAPIVINSPSLISIDNVNVTNVTGCYGNTNGEIEIIASGGTPPLAYSIDGGTTYQSTNTFTGLGGGTYTIMVNDINDCPQSDIVTITEPAEITIDNTTVNQESTPGASDGEIIVTASGGTGTLTYSITPNVLPDNTTGDFTGLGSGTYTVRVTDDNGCYVETGALVISSIDINITHTNVNCHGGTDGKITVTITGGFPPFTVVGTRISEMTDLPVTDEGGGVFTINNLSADTCLITITDNLSTVYTYQEIVTEPTQLIATYVSHTNPLCNGDTNGEVIFNIEGGTPFVTGTDSLYLIEWKDNGTVVGSVTDTIATGIGAGLYTFTISDQNGCSTDVDVPELIEPEPIKLVSLDQFDPTCYGEAIGTINATANGGTGVLRYIISGMLNDTTTTGVFENLPAGVYNLDVQDENGCSANFAPPVSVTLSEPAQIVISGLTPEDSLICPYDSLGFVRIQVSGGQPDYSYLWSNGQTSVDLEDVTSGDYTVTVTDALNCQVSKIFTVKGPQMLKLSADIDTALCKFRPTGDDGRITLSSSTGGNGSFSDLTFVWNDQRQTENSTLSNVSSGTYTVTVTDTKGCVYNFDYFVPIKPKYDFSASAGSDTTICYDNPFLLHGSAIGGDPSLTFTYKWYDDFDGDPIYIGQDTTVSLTTSKIYLLWIEENEEGCQDSATVSLNVLPEIGLEVPLYISAVQDSIISVIKGKEFNVDVITKSVEYATAFEWKPSVMFNPSDSWNSSLFITDDIISQIPAYRDTIFSDPITKRPTNFIIVDVIATTERGCTDSIRLYTRIVNKLGFGNVFSPNGDGINDVWSVPKDYLFPDLSIEIFNRWGSLVWSAKGDKAAKGWNGKTNSGKELPLGTYYYVIKFNVKTQGSGWKPVTGSVTIVR